MSCRLLSVRGTPSDVVYYRCLQPLDGSRALLLSYGHSDKSMRMAVYDTVTCLQRMTRL